MAAALRSSPLILLVRILLALSITSAHRTPGKQQAERLIRSFNLSPNESINIFHNKSSTEPAGLADRRFRFPGLVEDASSASSIADLGHHAGYYPIKNSYDAKMFYFFFESRGSREDPVVLWLTGGPGCSSQIALFYENGPFQINRDLSLKWNDFGWDMVSNLLYVDQPIGTGFSYSSDDRDIRHNEIGVSNDLYDFLQAFFQGHPEFVHHDFYITGESYAGHYIPALASRVDRGNKANEGIHINLKGFAIGNGLTDPEQQYAAYTDFALANKLILEADYARINQMIPACVQTTKQCQNQDDACLTAFDQCNDIFGDILSIAGDINVVTSISQKLERYYDIRKKCVGELCYDFSNMENLLNLDSVREALGVGNIDFVSCSSIAHEAMLGDWMKDYEVAIPPILEQGLRVLVYAGEYDLICNWLGNSRWVEAMPWSGQSSFVTVNMTSYMVDGQEAGLVKSFGPLTFMKVHNAGHMVPMDQPSVSLQMIRGWMNAAKS